MNRNTESHFAELPQVSIERSIFDRSGSHKTSFNTGELIPFYLDEVLPGDTFQVTTSAVVRLQTLLTPIMDNMYMDTYFFFVPNRIVWSHWKEFMGENTQSAWYPATEYSVPYITFPSEGFKVGTIADHFGIPVNVNPALASPPDLTSFPSALPFRGLAMICDQWFRDQNVTDPLYIPTDDRNQTGSNGSDYVNDVANGGMPFKVAKYHDYFTSALPSPQKGPAVELSLLGDLPLKAGDVYNFSGQTLWYGYPPNAGSPLSFPAPIYVKSESSGQAPLVKVEATTSESQMVNPANLYADISSATGITVNEMRLAFQLQKFYEKNARAGTRYREVLKEHFGVTSPDARMMIPEYLGGHRFPLTIHQITNNSQGESDFLGDLGAMSNTVDVHEDFVKSFTEHGYVIGVCCVRYDHTYSQGLERMWSRRNATDYYWPVFANIGEQPIKKREIFVEPGQLQKNDDVFGYQEAWAEYRFKNSYVTGEMRPGIPNSLASWHLADYYTSQPSLSDDWIREDKTMVDRVLAVSSEVSNQIFCDFYVKNIVTRPMPMYSIPGLIDHH